MWQGTPANPVSITAIEQAVLDVAERYPAVMIYCDPWQLKASVERLRGGHVRIKDYIFSGSSIQKLSTTLYQSVTSARLRTYADAELEREVTSLRVVEREGGWRMDHRAGGYSDRAVALAMALQAAQEHGQGRGIRSSVPRGLIRTGSDATRPAPIVEAAQPVARRPRPTTVALDAVDPTAHHNVLTGPTRRVQQPRRDR